jgi:predicted transcriptional regulator
MAFKASGFVFTLWSFAGGKSRGKDRRMSLTISLPGDLEARVQEAAARQGQDVKAYVIHAVERALRKRSLEEMLAPVRAQFAASGMTEEELTVLVKAERRAMCSG